MNKNMFRAMSALAVAAVAFASCNNEAKKVDEKAQAPAAQTGAMKIAYVEVDSIMSQYKFCKEYSLILQKKSQNIENTLAQKQRSLQAAAAKFSRTYRATNTLSSRQKPFRQDCRSRVPTCRLCSRDSALSSRTRQTASTQHCATASSTISLHTTRTRNILLSSARLVTISSMLTRRTTLPMRLLPA